MSDETRFTKSPNGWFYPTFRLEGVESTIKVGEKFYLSNSDAPDWAKGWFEVVEIASGGNILCKRAAHV